MTIRFLYSKTTRLMNLSSKSRQKNHQLPKPLFDSVLNRGMISNGVCITVRISESRNSEGGCTLSQVLEDEVPDRYFLSPAAMRKILNKLSPDRRGKGSAKQKE